MHDDLRRLAELENVDARRARLQRELEAAPRRRAELAELREQAEARLSEAKAALETAELERRRLEGEVRDQEEHVARLEQQKFQVKTNDQFRTMEAEIEFLKEKISAAETGVLEAMEVIDTQTRLVSETQEGAAKTRSEADAEERALAERESAAKTELGAVEAERQAAASGISAALLSRYDRIAARKQPAVVVVGKEMCGGCQVGIPPQHFLKLLSGEEVIACLSCQRILIHDRFVQTGEPAGS